MYTPNAEVRFQHARYTFDRFVEIAAEEARAVLAERPVMLDNADTIATFAPR